MGRRAEGRLGKCGIGFQPMIELTGKMPVLQLFRRRGWAFATSLGRFHVHQFDFENQK
jgi:hypothetical protein